MNQLHWFSIFRFHRSNDWTYDQESAQQLNCWGRPRPLQGRDSRSRILKKISIPKVKTWSLKSFYVFDGWSHEVRVWQRDLHFKFDRFETRVFRCPNIAFRPLGWATYRDRQVRVEESRWSSWQDLWGLTASASLNARRRFLSWWTSTSTFMCMRACPKTPSSASRASTIHMLSPT